MELRFIAILKKIRFIVSKKVRICDLSPLPKRYNLLYQKIELRFIAVLIKIRFIESKKWNCDLSRFLK